MHSHKRGLKHQSCVKDKTHRAAATQEQKMKKTWFRSGWYPRCSHGYPHPKPRFCCRRLPKPVFPHFSRVVVIHKPSRIRRKREAINTAWLSSDLFPPPQDAGRHFSSEPARFLLWPKAKPKMHHKESAFSCQRAVWMEAQLLDPCKLFMVSKVPTPRAHVFGTHHKRRSACSSALTI